MIYPSVKNETARLRTLVLGIPNDFGGRVPPFPIDVGIVNPSAERF